MIYDLKNPIQTLRNIYRENNIQVRKDWRGWSKLNIPIPWGNLIEGLDWIKQGTVIQSQKLHK